MNYPVKITIKQYRKERVGFWLKEYATIPIHIEISSGYEVEEDDDCMFIYDGVCDHDDNVVFKFNTEDEAVKFKLKFY